MNNHVWSKKRDAMGVSSDFMLSSLSWGYQSAVHPLSPPSFFVVKSNSRVGNVKDARIMYDERGASSG